MKNKLLIGTLLAEFLVFALATAIKDVPETPTTYTASVLTFKTETVAVCEYGEDSVYCHDELQVICGEDTYIAPKDAESVNCGDIEIQVPSITAFAVFDKDWKDPRYLEE